MQQRKCAQSSGFTILQSRSCNSVHLTLTSVLPSFCQQENNVTHTGGESDLGFQAVTRAEIPCSNLAQFPPWWKRDNFLSTTFSRIE